MRDGGEDILDTLSHQIIRHQVFGIDLTELMEKQKKAIGCPELLVPRFLFEIVKQLEANGKFVPLFPK